MSPTSPRETTPKDAVRFIQDELDSAALYLVMAEHEPNARLAEVYRRLSATERRHADHWIAKLVADGKTVPPHRLGWRTRVLASVARRFGAAAVTSIIAGQELADAERYANVADGAPGMDADERGHARALRAMAGGGAEGSLIARLEGRHRGATGNALRAAVLGANDGLLSNLSLIMGVAGANLAAREIVITGFAGLLAGAGSMALGEWLSVQSSRELFEQQIRVEQEELRVNPEEEQEELALIYEAKGLAAPQAREVARRLMVNENSALDTLAREELGIDPGALGGSALQAAGASFLLFAFGAIIPLLAFMFLDGHRAIIVSVASSAAGLFGIGAAITILTGRGVWFSGGRQVLVGLAAAALTFGVGHLVGRAIG